MSLGALDFAFFFPLVLALYWALPRRPAVQNAVLLAASYVFYASWDARLLPVLLFATGVDYVIGRYLGREAPQDADEASAAKATRQRQAALALSVVVNVGLLGYFKYTGFFLQSLHDLLQGLGLSGSVPVLRLALPLGISYYTLIKLAYILDVYRRRQKPCRSLLTFATFVAFFPQITAGPISRARQLMPQLERPRVLEPSHLAAAAGSFVLGFVMKSYVADWLAQSYVDPVFSAPDSYGPAGHWVALLAYGAQIFCDFAGYTYLAIGVGRFFGVELPANFNYPYLSQGLMEFWRRWHITLNQWLFDYIYGPLTTSRGWWRGRLGLGFLVVFLVSGLWHGARWTYVVWGLLHGAGLLVQYRWGEWYKTLCRRDRVWVQRRRSRPYALAGWVLTQAFFLFTLIPFRANTLAEAGRFTAGLVTGPGHQTPNLASTNLVACVLFLLGYHLLELQPGQRLRRGFFALPAPVRGVVYGLVIVFLFLFVPVGAGTFIYAQF